MVVLVTFYTLKPNSKPKSDIVGIKPLIKKNFAIAFLPQVRFSTFQFNFYWNKNSLVKNQLRSNRIEYLLLLLNFSRHFSWFFIHQLPKWVSLALTVALKNDNLNHLNVLPSACKEVSGIFGNGYKKSNLIRSKRTIQGMIRTYDTDVASYNKIQ